ncbi:unnamed protein product, partial [Polarella glacialis]
VLQSEAWGGPAEGHQPWDPDPIEDPLEELAIRAETAYNFGRAFHQLSINNLAVQAYQSALEMLEVDDDRSPASATSGDPSKTLKTRTDLRVIRHSAAFNLASIFRAQGSVNQASEVMWRHIEF